MNRRRLFGFGAGAVAAVTTSAKAFPLPPAAPQLVGGSDWLDGPKMMAHGSFIESAARDALRGKIDEEYKARERRMARLSRLRSVSQAFVDATDRGHRSAIDALQELLGKMS